MTSFIDRLWDEDIIPTLSDYILIPNKSPLFDPEWQAHGHMEKAVSLFEGWAKAKLAKVAGAKVEVIRPEGRTPLILIEIPGTAPGNVLLYGHLDKQPEMKGWSDGMGPWTPVLKDGKLYGRGGADDGYAMFAALSAILALHESGSPHARCVITIESGEESGSPDLAYYIDALSDQLGAIDLVVCLDSGCGNYEQLWLTTSLRGIAAGVLNIRVLTEGVHSGDASGIVPGAFRILRQLLSRIEDEASGAMKGADFFVDIPADRLAQAKAAAATLGTAVYDRLPFAGSTKPMAATHEDMILNRTWRPQLSVIGMDGYPAIQGAGNVLLPYASAKLSLRLPPTLDADKAIAALKKVLEENPPYDAVVEFDAERGQGGWNAPTLTPWLEKSLAKASSTHFGKPAAFMGEGGSIPFMGLLGEKFPGTQFVVTGVLGPNSNAHGPNEFLHIGAAKKVSASIADILADHAKK
ncbi:acetylornithine deacetylase/succinyl-diaminopimelate desuccinylase-like protein [Rhizomicrobium palustre]|uniref:Acetylornithine deacetylase/succinyl-diaminopimelate desuccinylase-like protein n=1 Tax=Rhizomicrobium palustre TaxID=189966 RepID=A0A846MXH0_9PROT|nr:M20/M25/M40 family metallo-hydrolase [Rhizomicrobium palustre]NIK88268.1 acetylornithine deacetylase/succinyl-diaminopimelate desuccinylase-like protein [Rhizomicrobium palustre]